MENHLTRTPESSQQRTRPLTRRVSPGYHNRGRNACARKMSFKEKFVMQCIVCGMILAAVLIIKLVNISPANRLSHTLSIAIADNISAESVKNGFTAALNSMYGMSDSIKNVFGSGAEINAEADSKQAAPPSEATNQAESTGTTEAKPPAQTTYPTQTITPNQPTNTEANAYENDNDFRIDEDILEQMNEESSYNSNQKNLVAPN